MYVIVGRGGVLGTLIGLFILLLVFAGKILVWSLALTFAGLLLLAAGTRGVYRAIRNRPARYRKMQARSQRILDELGPPPLHGEGPRDWSPPE